MSADPIWLLLSSAYVGQELAAEFGKLPPAFLPLGVRRLYDYQAERIAAADGTRYLTLPESFALPEGDVAALARHHITPLALPEGLSLGEAIVYAINLVAHADQPVRILHGDTLVDAPGDALDEIGVGEATEGYSWAEVVLDGYKVEALCTLPAGQPGERARPVATGYFAFSSSALLVRSITRARGGFIEGVNLYAGQRTLTARVSAGWQDFGHLRTFYRSRRAVTTARAFNAVEIDGRKVRKSSRSESAKIEAEANWLADLPPPLQIFAVRLLDRGAIAPGLPFYDTEYEYLPTLAELFVFGRLDRLAWSHILESCGEFLRECARFEAPAGIAAPAFHALAVEKTSGRLEAFARAGGLDSDFAITSGLCFEGRPMPSLVTIAEIVGNILGGAPAGRATVMHGDFCFSNILYNSRVQRIRVLDPRGRVREGEETLYGDARYDLAKLAHSVIGRYDQIIAGRCAIVRDGRDFTITLEASPHHAWVTQEFARLDVAGHRADSREVHAAMIGLFLSMLPLHADRPDRQAGFIANALRLFDGLEKAA